MYTNIFDTKYLHCYTCGYVFRREEIVDGKCSTCLIAKKTRKCACGKLISSECLCAYCYWERECEHDIIRVRCNTCNTKNRSVIRKKGMILKVFD